MDPKKLEELRARLVEARSELQAMEEGIADESVAFDTFGRDYLTLDAEVSSISETLKAYDLIESRKRERELQAAVADEPVAPVELGSEVTAFDTIRYLEGEYGDDLEEMLYSLRGVELPVKEVMGDVLAFDTITLPTQASSTIHVPTSRGDRVLPPPQYGLMASIISAIPSRVAEEQELWIRYEWPNTHTPDNSSFSPAGTPAAGVAQSDAGFTVSMHQALLQEYVAQDKIDDRAARMMPALLTQLRALTPMAIRYKWNRGVIDTIKADTAVNQKTEANADVMLVEIAKLIASARQKYGADIRTIYMNAISFEAYKKALVTAQNRDALTGEANLMRYFEWDIVIDNFLADNEFIAGGLQAQDLMVDSTIRSRVYEETYANERELFLQSKADMQLGLAYPEYLVYYLATSGNTGGIYA